MKTLITTLLIITPTISATALASSANVNRLESSVYNLKQTIRSQEKQIAELKRELSKIKSQLNESNHKKDQIITFSLKECPKTYQLVGQRKTFIECQKL